MRKEGREGRGDCYITENYTNRVFSVLGILSVIFRSFSFSRSFLLVSPRPFFFLVFLYTTSCLAFLHQHARAFVDGSIYISMISAPASFSLLSLFLTRAPRCRFMTSRARFDIKLFRKLFNLYHSFPPLSPSLFALVYFLALSRSPLPCLSRVLSVFL